MKYSSKLLKYFHDLSNMGCMPEDDSHVGTGRAGTRASGDVIKLQIKVSGKNVVEQVKFKAYGSVATIAACSWVSQWLSKKDLSRAADINSDEIAGGLQLPKMKYHCALLVEDAVKAAIRDYKEKNE